MKSQGKKHPQSRTVGKVYVGMSGGVDSSVSAAILKEAGYDVTGVFIKVWQPDWIGCTWREDRRDAMRVAAHLGIKFATLDLEDVYKKEVVDYMISEYKAGRTPNPDVMCNKSVKFGGFFDWAIRDGADYVATGHYARIKKLSTGEKDNHQLLAGIDKNKDQSYFLWTLTRKQLSKTIFPIGGMEKSEVRKLARKFKLPNSEKKDSQGLCFIGKIDVKEFLSHYIQPSRGNVLDQDGKIIGNHDGSFFYTIGERHGFEITKKTPSDQPLYVVSKNIEKNTITVARKEGAKKIQIPDNIVKLGSVNWNQGSIMINRKLHARSRYREELKSVVFTDQNSLHFDESDSIITPGQSLVVYDGDVCLGGGIIMEK